jgi:hypothetical protein
MQNWTRASNAIVRGQLIAIPITSKSSKLRTQTSVTVLRYESLRD